MSRIRKHNAPRVGWWLESYGDRFGAGPQEILRIENRKLLGSMPINAALREILGDEQLKKSDGVMLYLIFVKMREEKPALFDALFDTYLDPEFSVGDLDRLGRRAMGQEVPKDENVGLHCDLRAFDLIMRVYKARVWLLEELDRWQEPGVMGRGHELEVERGERARTRRQAATQDQQELAEANYLGMVEDYEALREAEPDIGAREAQKRVAKAWGVTDRTVRNALKSVRGIEAEEGEDAGGDA